MILVGMEITEEVTVGVTKVIIVIIKLMEIQGLIEIMEEGFKEIMKVGLDELN